MIAQQVRHCQMKPHRLISVRRIAPEARRPSSTEGIMMRPLALALLIAGALPFASCTRGAAAADCQKACDNVVRLVLADMRNLPDKELAQVRMELEAASSRCASDCLDEADSDGVSCVQAAKTMADLRACDMKGGGAAGK
jgi:hypothetical protein